MKTWRNISTKSFGEGKLTFCTPRYAWCHVPQSDGCWGDETKIESVKEGPEGEKIYNFKENHSSILFWKYFCRLFWQRFSILVICTTPRRWWRDKRRRQRRFQVCWEGYLSIIFLQSLFPYFCIIFWLLHKLGINPHPRVPTTLRIFLTIPTSAISLSSSSSSSTSSPPSNPSSSPSLLPSFFFPRFFNFWRIWANLSLLFFLWIRNCQKCLNTSKCLISF